MEPWTTREKMQSAVLPILFDQYEHGNRHGIDFDLDRTLTAEEKPIFDSWIGDTLANGWIEPYVHAGIRIPRLYVLTAAGYRYFKPEMDFKRVFEY